MNDLTEFLLARIAEDEEVAQEAAADVLEDRWQAGIADPAVVRAETSWFLVATGEHARIGQHIARFAPVRVLAECEAKRRIIERCVYTLEDEGGQAREWEPTDWAWFESSKDDANELLQLLAAVYADHPAYRPEWRP